DNSIIKEKIEDTRENVFIGRKVEIKKDGTDIKIRIKPDDGKTAGDFTYVESIPKGCLEYLYPGNPSNPNICTPASSEVCRYWRQIQLDFKDLNIGKQIGVVNDPVIVWNFGQEQITDKKEVEYELTSPEDCMRIINSLGFGEIS
ncbi:MAG: hypothetical protein ABIE22_03355, partial [archaeon]